MRNEPPQVILHDGVADCDSSAAAASTILNVEPGGYRVSVARLKSGRARSPFNPFQTCGGVTPLKNERS